MPSEPPRVARLSPRSCRAARHFASTTPTDFPFDLTVELAREQGLEVDQTGFDEALAEQRAASRGGASEAFRDRARSRAEVYVGLAKGPTEFLGYEETSANARVLGLVGPDGPIDEAEAGDTVEVVLDRTPFYGESGGQIGDTGSIRTETGVIDVDDTFKPTPDVYRSPRHGGRRLRPHG